MISSQPCKPFPPVSSWASAHIGTKSQNEASLSAPLPCRHTTLLAGSLFPSVPASNPRRHAYQACTLPLLTWTLVIALSGRKLLTGAQQQPHL
jgi:hypothetical protein